MSDFAAKLDQARQRLPLRRLMEQHGKGPPNGQKGYPKCPYCQHEGSAGVFTAKDRRAELFKCHYTSCPTQNEAFDEIGFLAFELGLTREEAAKTYLREAGVWEERERLAPSVMPGQQARKRRLPAGAEESEAFLIEVGAWLKTQTTLSLRALMKQFEFRHERAKSVMAALEARQWISAQGENGLRTILPAIQDVPPAPSAEPQSAVSETSSSLDTVPPAIPGEPVDSNGIQSPPATEPATGPAGGDVSLQKTVDADIEKFVTFLKLTEKRAFTFLDLEGAVGFARAKELMPVMETRGWAIPKGDGNFGLGDGRVSGISEIHMNGNGGDEPPKPPDDGGEETPEASPPMMALRWFYERLELSAEDRKELFVKRGLVDATIDLFGYRSNPQSNKELLLSMEKEFPMPVLLECGLWKLDDHKISDPPKPNPQYYGMSLVEKRDAKGKKVRDDDGEVVRECIWNRPILIPYFDEHGDLIHLRPHKGMMKDKAPQFYIARPAKQYIEGFKKISKLPQFGVITEGEFKAAAIWQAVGDIGRIGAIPGITMAKLLIGDIEEWLEASGLRQVVVGYDNEEKGDPNLPSYQEDEWKRFDSQAWARYLARQLSKQGYDGRVGVLPDDWRDENGKADWDGRLATIIHQFKTTDGMSQRELWERVYGRARNEFLQVIKGARPVAELWQAGFFDKTEERIIKNKLEKISYEPCLPIGGDDEQTMARRLRRYGMKLKRSEWFNVRCASFLFTLASAWTQTQGRYYIMKPLTDKQDAEWVKLLETARNRRDEDAKRACELVLRGRKTLNKLGHIPAPVSDFYFKPQYVLHRINGTRTRMVTSHNVHGVNTGLLSLPSKDFGSPVKFRDWLLDSSTGGAWWGGQNELTGLHEDLGHELAFKDVMEVPLRGYHEKSKLWFWEDVCFSDDGSFFKPDAKTGIFWVRRDNLVQGYSFARDSSGRPRDREDEVFRQGVPKMFPEKPVSAADVSDLFKDVCRKLEETLGGFEAFMALGMVMACAAGPEIFKMYSAFPGLWVHGAQGEGKSSVVRWLLRIWGFAKEKGLPLPSDERGTLTAAALAGALGQYGEIPIWLDEYQPTAPSWVRAILKNSYDRAEGGKKDFGSSPREFLSAVIVSGIATSTEPQTKSRFAHIQVSSEARTANHYQWFQTESHQFYKFGRFLLQNRKAYAAAVLQALSVWMNMKSMKDVDDRARMVHGVAFAGFLAACEIMNVSCDPKYLDWLIQHCVSSAAEVQESVSVDLFWREILTAMESGAFGDTPADRRRYWHVIEDSSAPSPVSVEQTKRGTENPYTAWRSLKLYFQPGPVIEMLRMHKRKSGRDFAIQQTDLRNQMKVQRYWVESSSRYGHKQKFNGSNKSCWCIAVDRHELGLNLVPDDEFFDSFKAEGQQGLFVSSDKWMDPRKGDLFGLIDSLQSKKKEDESNT